MFIFSVDRCRNITALLPQASYVRERLGGSMRKVVAIAALACGAVLATPDSGRAICNIDFPCPPPPTPTAPIGAGPWVVGGVGLAALSVIIRAAVVGNRQPRELTPARAVGAVGLPLVWGFLPPGPVRGRPVGPRRGIPPEPITG